MTHAPSQMPDEIYGWEYGGRHYAEKPPVDPDSWTFIKYIRADLASTRAASVPSDTNPAYLDAIHEQMEQTDNQKVPNLSDNARKHQSILGGPLGQPPSDEERALDQQDGETVRSALSTALPDIEKDPLGHHLESLRLLGYPVTMFAEFPKKGPAPQDLEALKRDCKNHVAGEKLPSMWNENPARYGLIVEFVIDHLAATHNISKKEIEND